MDKKVSTEEEDCTQYETCSCAVFPKIFVIVSTVFIKKHQYQIWNYDLHVILAFITFPLIGDESLDTFVAKYLYVGS